MDRTVPKTGSEEIELYMRTYYSLLRSSDAIQIETLEESHKAMESSLHNLARASTPDIAALTYASLRLPSSMPEINLILIGQLEESFSQAGYEHVSRWQRVNSPGRRRRVHYDGNATLAVFIASRSDIDDIVPMLTAYQIEWNKLHALLQSESIKAFLARNVDRTAPLDESEIELLGETFGISHSDVERLQIIWKDSFFRVLVLASEAPKRIRLKSLASSMAAYRRATVYWWNEIDAVAQENGIDLQSRPVYFISSNTHSVPNLLSGFAWRHESELVDYLREKGHENLLAEYTGILNGDRATNRNNFLYYLLKKYLSDRDHMSRLQVLSDEQTVGIYRAPNRHGFQIAAQIIELQKLKLNWMDPRICEGLDLDLSMADAVIINIDYPLGMAAYEIMNRITERVGRLLGTYVMGKAATLNARVGDVMIPNVVHDEHSQNTYLFSNCFSSSDVAPHMAYGMVLDNQKAISAPGTFLQNPQYMGVFYKEGYTDIEMEAGPYLSSVYEAYRPTRHPQNQIVNLHGVPFDIGFLHYASDTPMGRGHNLGSSNLSYAGVDPTYATAIAILHRVLSREAAIAQTMIQVKQPAMP